MLLPFALWLSVVALALPAFAQSPIRVPAGCGTEEEFRSEIERLTGAPAGPVMPSALQIEAIDGDAGGYELRLALRDEIRVLRDPDCRILWRSAIVITAAARNEAPPPDTSPSAPPAPSPALPPSVPGAPGANRASGSPPAGTSGLRGATPVAPGARGATSRPLRSETPPRRSRLQRSPARRPQLRVPRERAAAGAGRGAEPAPARPANAAPGEPRVGLGLGVGVSAGVLPDLGGVFELGGRLEVLPWALDVSLRHWLERSRSREGRAVDVSSTGMRVAGLFRVASALHLMLGLEVNRLVGAGAEGVSGRNADAVWQLAPTVGVSLVTWDIRSLRLEIGAAGRLSVARPRFLVEGFGDLYRVPLLGADAIIRGVWLFP